MWCRRNRLSVMAVAFASLNGCAEDSTAPGSADPPASFATVGGAVIKTALNVSGSRTDSRATDVSNQGVIVGWRTPSNAPFLFSAFVWTPATPRGTTGAATDLATLGSEATADGINATGHIVGMSRSTSTGVRKAVLWSPSVGGGYGAPLDLGTAPGKSGGSAWAITDFQNGSAQVAGSTDYTLTEEALVWTVTLTNGTVTSSSGQLLGGLQSGQGSSARGINAVGRVVGYANVSAPSGFHNHAVLWTRSGTTWTILELRPNSVQSIAWGINTLGYIVGQNGTHAFVRAPNGAVTTLPTLGGTTASAFGINDAREISGYASTAGGQRHAVLWLPSGSGYSIKDLGKPSGGIGFRLNEPSGGATEVVGSATSASAERAILWTAR
jgi:uncharacterized membrane protein